jgi:4'-phosphopantetheinyl transferase
MVIPWPETAEPPPLAADEVHVWSAPLDNGRIPWTGHLPILSPDERERAKQFRVEDARRHFVTARAALRKLLSRYLRTPAESVAFDYETNGKPHLQRSTSPVDLYFNLAHSGELALIAVTRGSEVGVDVERLRDVHRWREIAERYFHPREIDDISALPADHQLAAFMRCWTSKEAVLKAIGVGITRPLDFFVGGEITEVGTWIELGNSKQRMRCHLRSLMPDNKYLGAVACLDSARTLRLFATA